MTSNYARGARLERLARASLQRHGYTVIRSAGSKGAVDLAAFCPQRILLIQVKAERVTPADRRKLACFPAPPLAIRQFWIRELDGWTITDVDGKPTALETAFPTSTLTGEPHNGS